jgi:hypothetical protein
LINASLLCCEPSRNCFAYRDHRCCMQTIEITNPIEARRSPLRPIPGRKGRLDVKWISGQGMVRSVREDRSSISEPVSNSQTERVTREPKLSTNQRVMYRLLVDAGPAGLVVEEWNELAKANGITRKQRHYEARMALKVKA